MNQDSNGIVKDSRVVWKSGEIYWNSEQNKFGELGNATVYDRDVMPNIDHEKVVVRPVNLMDEINKTIEGLIKRNEGLQNRISVNNKIIEILRMKRQQNCNHRWDNFDDNFDEWKRVCKICGFVQWTKEHKKIPVFPD